MFANRRRRPGPRRALHLWVALIAGVAGVGPGAAAAPPSEPPLRPDAQARYDEGMALYAARDYRGAMRALGAAYALDGRPEILFAEAQAARLAGDCLAALPLYDRFLATHPPPQQVEATRIAVGRCQAARAPAPPPPAPLTITIAPPPAAPRWYRDPRGAVRAGAGVVGLGTGIAFLLAAGAADADAQAEHARYDRYEAHRETAERRRLWGIGALLGGSLLLASGVWRYVHVMARPDGGGVGAEGRF